MTEQPLPDDFQRPVNRARESKQTKAMNTRPRRAQLIIAGITVGLLLLVGGTTVLNWTSVETGAAADIPTDSTSDWLDGQDRNLGSYTVGWEKEMNEALQSGDRDLFLANAEGEAKELLGYWWDGTREVGWDYAFTYRTLNSENVEYLNLGIKLDFTPQPARASGSQDAGLVLTQQFSYELTLEGEGEDAIVTGLEPMQPMPWDEGPIYVQKSELVVLFAPEHERDLVDANIAIAQEAAEETFEVMDRIGAELPTAGFTAAITDDQERFDLWSGGLEELVNFEVAGFADSTERPSRRTEFMPADIATGPYTSGSWIGMGPKSADSRKAVFIHEYAHALHEAALPYGLLKTWSMDTVEGFAEYVEESATGEGSYTMDPRAKDNIAVHEGGAMSDDRLRRPDAYLGYWAASSYFHFLEATGGSPWQLAMDRDEGLTMPQRAMRQGSEFNEQAWLDWVSQQ